MKEEYPLLSENSSVFQVHIPVRIDFLHILDQNNISQQIECSCKYESPTVFCEARH